MKKNPCMCFGMTLYNNARYLRDAIESLLNQTYKNFFIVAIDDCSSDDTDAIMRSYAEIDNRISYFRNDQRAGMVATWRNVYLKAKDLFKPDYFAWASDHDIWHVEWLEDHINALEKNTRAVLTYPDVVCIDVNGETQQMNSNLPFDTVGMNNIDRFYHVCRQLSGAGNKVYGLFRSDALEKAGIFRNVTLPDRLLIIEISQYGEFKYIPKKLWFRRYINSVQSHDETVKKQVEKLFGQITPPFYVNFPYMTHFTSLICSSSDGNTSSSTTFFSRLLLAMIFWESNKSENYNEISKFSDYLNLELKKNSNLQGPFELIKTGTDIIEGKIEDPHSKFFGLGEYAQTLLFGMLVISNYLNPKKSESEKLIKKQLEIKNLEMLLVKYKGKLLDSREKQKDIAIKAEYWKRQASLGITKRILQRIKRRLKITWSEK